MQGQLCAGFIGEIKENLPTGTAEQQLQQANEIITVIVGEFVTQSEGERCEDIGPGGAGEAKEEVGNQRRNIIRTELPQEGSGVINTAAGIQGQSDPQTGGQHLRHRGENRAVRRTAVGGSEQVGQGQEKRRCQRLQLSTKLERCASSQVGSKSVPTKHAHYHQHH